MHTQQSLNNYFSNHWRGYLNLYQYSGVNLAKKIQHNEYVLDVGCGLNAFKSLVPNLIGIDPAFPQADLQIAIEDFRTTQLFDVAFCLGSINFGNETKIKNQIQRVISLLKPAARIYWRCNPGRQDHGNTECKSIEFFPWSPELLIEYATQFGFEVLDIKNDLNNRIYCEWARSIT